MKKGAVVSKNEEIATHFNNYFNDITKGLNIKKWCVSEKLSDDPLVNVIHSSTISYAEFQNNLREILNNFCF